LTAAIVLTAGASFAQPKIVLSASSAQTTAGAVLTLDLLLNAPAGSEPAGLQFDIVFPADISGMGAALGAAAQTAGKQLDCAAPVALVSPLRCLITGLNATTIANGVVARVTFTLSNAPAPGQKTIDLAQTIAVTPAALLLPSQGVGGTLRPFACDLESGLEGEWFRSSRQRCPGPRAVCLYLGFER
jgi:hypothetical protein